MSEQKISFEKEFSDNSFWDKVKDFAITAGKEVIEKALWLYFAAESKQTPILAKATIFSSLGYFILPIDAIPDVAPVIGFTDDLGILTAAFSAVSAYVVDEVKQQAEQKLHSWFKD